MEQRTLFKTVDKSGLRVSFVEYANPSHDGPTVTLLPMIHAADDALYEEASYMLHTADVVLFEGAAPSWLLSQAKRLHAALSRRFKLALENSPRGEGSGKTSPADEWTREMVDSPREKTWTHNLCDDDACDHHLHHVRVVWADLDRAETSKVMKQATLIDKIKVFGMLLAFPFILPFVFKKDDRDDLIETLSTEWDRGGQGSGDHIFGTMKRYILDARDAYLAKCLRRELDDPENAGQRIIVKYGGAHMPVLDAVLQDEYGYRVQSQRNILAIARDPAMQAETPDEAYGSSQKIFNEISNRRFEAIETARLAKIAEQEAALRAAKRAKRTKRAAEDFSMSLKIKQSNFLS